MSAVSSEATACMCEWISLLLCVLFPSLSVFFFFGLCVCRTLSPVTSVVVLTGRYLHKLQLDNLLLKDIDLFTYPTWAPVGPQALTCTPGLCVRCSIIVWLFLLFVCFCSKYNSHYCYSVFIFWRLYIKSPCKKKKNRRNVMIYTLYLFDVCFLFVFMLSVLSFSWTLTWKWNGLQMHRVLARGEW